MTLRDVLKAVVAYTLPDEMDWSGDPNFKPEEIYQVSIRTMAEDETAFVTYPGNPILIPWYGAEVYGLGIEDEQTLEIWIKYQEYIREKINGWLGCADGGDGDG